MMDTLGMLRAAGWTVAVHNDYRAGGDRYTFWLLTHECGRWVKGEGRTDEQALKICLTKVQRFNMDNRPPSPYACKLEDPGHCGVLTLQFNTYEQAQAFWEWAQAVRNLGTEVKDGAVD